jgi:hypothetical protein
MKSILMLVLALTLAATAASAALAGGGGGGGGERVIKRGQCSRGTDWTLKVKHDDAALEVELEVDQNRVGRRWRVNLLRNGTRFFRGIRVTRAPSGSFTVERRTRAGATNRIVATAGSLSSGETCRAVATA